MEFLSLEQIRAEEVIPMELVRDTQTFDNNTWHHLAATFDGKYIKQYFDGVLKGTVDLGATYTIRIS